VQPAVTVDAEVIRKIRQHARSCNKAEVCGVLIGSEDGHGLAIEACIAGANAAQAGTHVTFTQDTWAHIYETRTPSIPTIESWAGTTPSRFRRVSLRSRYFHSQEFFFLALQVRVGLRPA